MTSKTAKVANGGGARRSGGATRRSGGGNSGGGGGVEESLGDYQLKAQTYSTDDDLYIPNCDICIATAQSLVVKKKKAARTKAVPKTKIVDVPETSTDEEDRNGGGGDDWSDDFKDEGSIKQKNTFDSRDGPSFEKSEATYEEDVEVEDDRSDKSGEMGVVESAPEQPSSAPAVTGTERAVEPAARAADVAEAVCLPHKLHILQEEIKLANNGITSDGHYAIINKLHELGVTVYVVGRADVESDANLMASIKHITRIVTHDENREEKQRCLLYQDRLGRVYNLTLGGKVAGLAGKWESSLLTFSAFEAMIALTILARTLPCARNDSDGDVRPAYLSLILGLVLSEEISNVRMHVSMLVRGTPSISAYALLEHFITDWPRKLVILLLAMAGAAGNRNDRVQTYLTLSGVILACLILAANLGARAWHHMGGHPMNHPGFCGGILAYIQAIIVGLLFPHLGHREVSAGGKVALETMLRCAFFVAVAFVASDIDEIQRFVVVGSENCDQSHVNLVVGFWWAATLMICILRVRYIPSSSQEPEAQEEEEPLLVPDQDSPVGFRVPHLPNFAVDPSLKSMGWPFCSLCVEQVLGVVMALVGGLLIVSLAYGESQVDSVYDLF